MSVTGNLPRLHINLSDRKYKTIMRILDLISGKASQREGISIRQQVQAMPLEWTFPTSSTELVLDESDDSFFDAEETLEPGLSEKSFDNPNRILLLFSFEVGLVSASLMKSRKEKDADDILAKLQIDGFNLLFRQRPFDMKVGIRIRSISIKNEQLLQPFSQYLLAPTHLGSPQDQQLLVIEYLSVNRQSPAFAGIDQTLDISFASVDVSLVKDSILALYDFVLVTFTGSSNPKPTLQPAERKADLAPTEPAAAVKTYSVMVIRAKMKSINFIVIQNTIAVATLSFGAGQLSLTMKESGTSIAGRLGNLSIVDNVERVGSGRVFKQLLRIDGSEVADFTLDTFNKGSDTYPGYDTSLRLRTSSVKVTFIEPLLGKHQLFVNLNLIDIVELVAYFREFTQLHYILESARRAAAETQETAGKFHFDLHIETPVMEFPSSLQSPDSLSIYLGRISASNSFRSEDGIDINDVVADIRELKLVSSLESQGETKIMEDVSIETHVLLHSKAGESRPGTVVGSKRSFPHFW
ncbi:hypothetical protein HDU96_004088 [Phlyctochytrium bullatum]|nr:hypothetical protein HDU96_004088 [Phlyctochytrium bullatum]